MAANEYWLYIVICLAVILIGATILASVYFVNKQDRINRAFHLEQLNAEIDSMETERARFAADLHDELNMTIAAVTLKLQVIEVPEPEDEKILASCVEHLRSVQQQIREISNGLMPRLIAKDGLVAAIQEFIYSFNNPGELHINFVADKGMRVPKQLDLPVYRILLEIIHNCVKHAGAGVLNIHIYEKGGVIKLVASDNGVGYDTHAIARESSGTGLRNIATRVASINATMEIKSNPGKGTLTIIGIPANK